MLNGFTPEHRVNVELAEADIEIGFRLVDLVESNHSEQPVGWQRRTRSTRMSSRVSTDLNLQNGKALGLWLPNCAGLLISLCLAHGLADGASVTASIINLYSALDLLNQSLASETFTNWQSKEWGARTIMSHKEGFCAHIFCCWTNMWWCGS